MANTDAAGVRRTLDEAEAHLSAAAQRARAWPLAVLRPIPIVGSPVKAIEAGSRAGVEVVAAGRQMAGTMDRLFPDSETVDGHDLTALHHGAVASLGPLDTAARHLGDAQRILGEPAGAFLPIVSAPARSFQSTITDALAKLGVAERALSLTGELTAPGRSVRLLFLSQDSAELRPTGGLIGSFGVLTLADGRAELTNFAGIGTVPWPSPRLEPPPSLAPAVDVWTLPNANWSPDFPTAARTAAEMYRRGGNEKVDGVLAMTEHTIARLLKVLGPVQLPSYTDPVTHEDFAKRVIYEIELKRPLDEPRKKFLTELSGVLFDKLSALPRHKVPAVLEALGASAMTGDTALWLEKPEWQALLDGSSIAGTLPPPDGDVVQLAEANMTASKANLGLTRDIDYTVKRRKDGRLLARLAIRYRNDEPKSEINPYYNGLLRVYVPHGVERVLFSGTYSDAPEGPYSVITHPIFVSPDGGTAEAVFEYLLPEAVVKDGRYRLNLVRQPGTPEDRYTVKVAGRTFTSTNGERRIQVNTRLK